MSDFGDLLERAPAGPRIELGVCNGGSLAEIADHPGLTIGVDSFEGMGEPTERDRSPNGKHGYPKGRLAASMVDVNRRFPGVTLIRGWIPEVFDTWLGGGPGGGPYAFAHVDLDHYEPTKASIAWLWLRMLPGGIICCDDWFEGRDHLAAAAINEVAARHPLSGTLGRKAWWIR